MKLAPLLPRGHNGTSIHQDRLVQDISKHIALLQPTNYPLTTLFNELSKVNQDYEDAKEFIRETVEAYR